MNPKVLVANWKLNPTSLNEAKELFNFCLDKAGKYPVVTIVVCPPFLYIEELAQRLQVQVQDDHVSNHVSNLFLGAQDVFWQEQGAFTGEISSSQLSEFGIEYVLVGHSERRALGETDEMINKKLLAALARGIRPVLLVGEKDKKDYREDILIDQLSRDLAGVDANQVSNLVVCYEPVWAISSHSEGVSDTPENALEAIKVVRNILAKIFGEVAAKTPILYGGSVNASNIEEFLKHDEISGVVVGSASLKPKEFNKILVLANSLT